MITIQVRNVHQALPEGMYYLRHSGLERSSRAGRVLVAPGPVMTVYSHPTERVLFWPQRDANPFFHLMEALWMLAGRNDLAWLERFNSKMREFSDNGVTLHGAYGYRWRYHFGRDQLNQVVELLRLTPNSRRAVIQMWDCNIDFCELEKLGSLDTPCNDLVFLEIRDGCLNQTVLCRSNDIIWGAYGTNAVHFSVLQEYLASRIGVRVGIFYQFSNNYHAYEDIFRKNEELVDKAASPYRRDRGRCPYTRGEVYTIPIVSSDQRFEEELVHFMGHEGLGERYSSEFLQRSSSVRESYIAWKNWRDPVRAIRILRDGCPTDGGKQWDFSLACIEWLERRKEQRLTKKADQ